MKTQEELDKLRIALLEITSRQQLAVEALANGATHQGAADIAGVTRETVTRWSGHLPAFRAALNRYRLAAATEQITVAQRVRGKALAAVEASLDDGSVNPLAVLRALRDVPVSIGAALPSAILISEAQRVQAALPPAPAPSDLEGLLESLSKPSQTSAERAEALTIEELSVAAGVASNNS